VLDFGLVKAVDNSKQSRQSGGLVGTPLYMSPEAIQTPDLVDSRSDIYAVGAVGYFLLTGQPVFRAATLVELCQQHSSSVPDAPSQRLARAVSAELEAALLACLEKSPAKRPQTARDLSGLLDRSPTAGSWTLDDADAGWGRHDRSLIAGGAGLNSSSAGVAAASAAAPRLADGPGNRTTTAGFDQTMAIGDDGHSH